MSDLLKDQNGALSSKRVSGIVCGSAGALILVAVAVVSFFVKIPDPSTAIDVGKFLLGIGCGLLGIGVIEFFAPKSAGTSGTPEGK